MRRGQTVLLSILALLLVVPIAGADDKAGDAGAGSAVGVTADHVVLRAPVLAGVKGAGAVFQYGTSGDYGAIAAAAPAKLPKSLVMATAAIDGLLPATTYHFRVVLIVAGVALTGPDSTFTTEPAAPAFEPQDQHPSSGAADAPLAPVEALAPPKLGRTVAVGPVAGTIRVRTPHGRLHTLTAGQNVPSGSVIDASRGTVAITSALAGGRTQTGEFHSGRFLVRQARRDGMVDLYLRGALGRCHHSRRALATTARNKKKRSRRLWGRDHGGRYRTHGANSVATVRGTRWLTRDSCSGTLTKVTEGVVSVRDLRRHRKVTVRAGHSYLAHRRR